MTPQQVQEHFGGTQQRVAESLGIHQTTVSKWWSQGYVPLGVQYEIQVLTAGLLRADPDAVPLRKRRERAL